MAVKKSGKTAETIVVKPEDIKVDRAKEFDTNISFDITLFGCVKVYGLSYRTWLDPKDGEEKGIIGFPSKKGKDDKYYNHVYFFVSAEVLAKVEKEIEALI